MNAGMHVAGVPTVRVNAFHFLQHFVTKAAAPATC